MKSLFKSGLFLSVFVGALSCNSGGGGDKETTTISGSFVDSAVAGLEYVSGDFKGETDFYGGFQCKSGESITFYINGIEIGKTTCRSVVTPLTVTNATDYNDPKALNLAYLLQSMDDDGLIDDGIDISAQKASVTSIDLSDDASIDTLVATMSNPVADRATAKAHAEIVPNSIGEYIVDATCDGEASDPNYGGYCEAFSLRMYFDGARMKIMEEGYGPYHNSQFVPPTMAVAPIGLLLGGLLDDSSRNTTFGTVDMLDGFPLYFKDNEETTDSVCDLENGTYYQHAIRMTDIRIDAGTGVGSFAYTVTCNINSNNVDFDEFWGSLTFTKI